MDYVNVEYKFVGDPKDPKKIADIGSDRLGKTKDGLQGSSTWIAGSDRLEKAAGVDVAIDVRKAINSGRVESVVVTIRPDGSTFIEVLDAAGKPKSLDTSKIIKPSVNPAGVKP